METLVDTWLWVRRLFDWGLCHGTVTLVKRDTQSAITLTTHTKKSAIKEDVTKM